LWRAFNASARVSFARSMSYWRTHSLAEVRAEFARVATQLEVFAAHKTDDEMNAPAALPWAHVRALWEFVGNDTFLHEWPAHALQIETAAATHAP
jgi:hypothetical protein